MSLDLEVSQTPRTRPPSSPFGLETRYDASFVAALALREKQVQQSYRPIISIHKWFARRPGSVFRSLMLSEFVDAPLNQSYWQSNNVAAAVADPFMGGGTTIFEALRLGLSVVGCDINPMAYWIVRQAVEPLDLQHFHAAATKVIAQTEQEVGRFYTTACTCCGEDVAVKYFLWAKTCPCPSCGEQVALHPGYLVAEAVRHPRDVYHCPSCDSLCEVEANTKPECPTCSRLLMDGNARRGTAECLNCLTVFTFARQLATPPQHRLFAIEYQCPTCYPTAPGRQFKSPDDADRQRYTDASAMFQRVVDQLPIPDDHIPAGDETNRLHRWGYHKYREMFNDRQLFGLGLLLRAIEQVSDQRIRYALATVFSDFLRYQNLLGRYDTYALKCQDIFSVHGYPVGLIVCEDSLLGIPRVGSGSFVHFVEKFSQAKDYAQRPYETRMNRSRKTIVRTLSEQIEAPLAEREPDATERAAWLVCEPSQDLELAPDSLDGVFTDPPYFDNVQYAELMDFCFVWLRQLLLDDVAEFERLTTRTEHELTGNDTLGRDLENFTQGLSSVFRKMAEALKEGAPLVFTYHHNDPLAYAPLVVALLDAGLTCTAVLPTPAEMTASLHIAGTKSSILDSVFVCRDEAWVQGRHALGHLWSRPIDERVAQDTAKMAAAGYRCTPGDLQCLRAGHIASDAVRALATSWSSGEPLPQRLRRVHECTAAVIRGDV
jgi:adenine-specific DNA methylase